MSSEAYDRMEVGDGGTASREFVRVTFDEVPEAERQQVRCSLENYCALDTRGMVVIMDALCRHVLARATDSL